MRGINAIGREGVHHQAAEVASSDTNTGAQAVWRHSLSEAGPVSNTSLTSGVVPSIQARPSPESQLHAQQPDTSKESFYLFDAMHQTGCKEE